MSPGAPSPGRLPPLDAATARARAAVAAALADLEQGARVEVACSGGADSLALAAATAFVAPRAGLRAGAVVVDHGWHTGSAAVASRAAAACQGLGLEPVDVVRVDPDGPGGPEAAARRARYAALDAVADARGSAAVLLGHTLDDQAETVLLGLARGSGTRSLAGMAASRGRYRRPFLGLERAETARVCAAAGLRPWSDPANDDARYARVRARRALADLDAALGPGFARALARTAELARADADALDAQARLLLADAAVPVGQPHAVHLPGPDAAPPVQLDVACLAAAPDAVRTRALRLAAIAAGSPAGALAHGHVIAVDALVTGWRGQGPASLPGGVEASRACGRLLLRAARPPGPALRRGEE